MAGLALVKNMALRESFDEKLSVGMICQGHCFRSGLILRAVGDRMIISPPLTMTHAEIDDMVALILQCLDLTYEDVKQNGWLV
jgi:putrescine aminotransferase